MKNIMIVLLSIFILSGCGTIIKVPIDSSPLSVNKATVIIIHEQGFTDEFKVFLDRKPIGIVTSEVPLKIAVTPGFHDFHVELICSIDRITNQYYEAGKTYYMRIWFDMGMWVSSVRIEPTYERESYEVRSYK